MPSAHETETSLWDDATGGRICGQIFEVARLRGLDRLQVSERKGGRCKVQLEAWIDEAAWDTFATIDATESDSQDKGGQTEPVPCLREVCDVRKATSSTMSEEGFWFLRSSAHSLSLLASACQCQ